MKGIAATVLRLLYVSGLQRWLLGIGLVLMLFGIGAQVGGWRPAAQPLLSIAAILGIITAVVAPVVVDPLLFRSLSAPRSMQLIPHARLKLVLGAFCAQLLLALFIGVSMGALNAHGTFHPPSAGVRLGTACIIAFGALTLIFVIFSWALRSRLSLLICLPAFLVVPRLVTFMFPHRNPGASLTSPEGLWIVTGASLLAWLLFALTFSGAQKHKLPLWETDGLRSVSKRKHASPALLRERPRYDQREAIRIMLTGNANALRTIVLVVLIVAVASVVLTLLTPDAGRSGRDPVMWSFLICLFAALVPGVHAGMMARRARSAWLTAAMGRAELFTLIEAFSWRLILLASGFATAMAILLLLALGMPMRPFNFQVLGILALPLACGSALVYVGLLYVRGNRLTDNLILAANTLLLFAEIFSATIQSQILYSLIGLHIVLVPLLREVARRRWTNIDWLLIRQPLAAARQI